MICIQLLTDLNSADAIHIGSKWDMPHNLIDCSGALVSEEINGQSVLHGLRELVWEKPP